MTRVLSGLAKCAATSSLVIEIRLNRAWISGQKFSETVPNTSRNCASTSSPRCEACASTIGFPIHSSRPTSQSIAFLNAPGTARAYSGQDTTIPSARATSAAKASTAGGAGGPSKSGENNGKWPGAITSITAPAGSAPAKPCNNAVFVDAARKDPDSPNNRMCPPSSQGAAPCFIFPKILSPKASPLAALSHATKPCTVRTARHPHPSRILRPPSFAPPCRMQCPTCRPQSP